MTRLAICLTLSLLFVHAQNAVPAGDPAQIIVTVGHFFGRTPLLAVNDLEVTQGLDPVPVIQLTPFRGEQAGMELYILVDNCSSCDAGSQFQELRGFIRSLPATTAVGIASILDGHLQIAEKPTADREKALTALDSPRGSAPANPFLALTELISQWDSGSRRREVLMISNGIDPAAKERGPNAPADKAIESAQRAGVIVFTIYHPSADYITTDPGLLYWGQVQLAHVSLETGGESYLMGFGPTPRLSPFLLDLADHLANQYLLEFLAAPAEGGMLRDVHIRSVNPDLDLIVPDKGRVLPHAGPSGVSMGSKGSLR
jgi:hypothetical protein